MEWNKLNAATKINILANESTVEHNLLLECDDLVAAIKRGASKEDCLKIIGNNF